MVVEGKRYSPQNLRKPTFVPSNWLDLETCGKSMQLALRVVKPKLKKIILARLYVVDDEHRITQEAHRKNPGASPTTSMSPTH